MKIKIQCDKCSGTGLIQRECCQQEDLKVVQPQKSGTYMNTYFCIHCGQRYKYKSYTDAAGSTDYELKPMEKENE
jgi:hypothetical protein